MTVKHILGAAVAVGSVLGGVNAAMADADEVNVYSYRQPFLIEPMLEAFTRETGVKVNVVFAKKGLVERMKREGANSPADVLLTVDIGRLTNAYQEGVTRPVSSDVLSANIPARFRQENGNWFGLSTRARIVYASKDRVKPGEISSYEDLAKPEWKGRICTRSGTHVYQVALTASMIAHHGVEGAEAWMQGLKNNLARKPEGNDRAQVKAISEGLCDLSLGNNYYYGKMLENDDQKAWADSVRLVFPNQGDRGTHVNISGVAMARNAPHPKNALKLMEFLSSDLAQSMYAEVNYEYPVKPGVKWSKAVESWGSFKSDPLSLETVAENRAAAIRIADRVGYNE